MLERLKTTSKPRQGKQRRVQRDEVEPLTQRLLDWISEPRIAWGLIVSTVFAIAACVVVLWSREQPLIAVGRVMDETRLVRVQSLSLPDRAATEQRRTAARQSTPWYYVANVPVFTELETAITNLPKALSATTDLASVDEGLRAAFGLTQGTFDSIRAETANGEPTDAWKAKVTPLMDLLRQRPVIDEQTFQRSTQEGTYQVVRLLWVKEQLPEVFRDRVYSISDEKLRERMLLAAQEAGFRGPIAEVIANRLVYKPQPTYRFDQNLTTMAQNDRAAAELEVFNTIPKNQPIFRRGERLTSEQAALYLAEARAFRDETPTARRTLRLAAVVTAVVAITLALVGYTVLFSPRVKRNASRMIGVASVLLAGLVAAVLLTAAIPQGAAITAVAPTVAVGILMAIGYDRRSALAYGLLHALLTGLALRSGFGTLAIITVGISCVVTTLGELRDRRALLRLSIFTALGVGLATVVFGIIDRPILADPASTVDTGLIVLREIFNDALLAAGGMFALGAATLMFLQQLERMFDVVTGLRLIELRDPKNPLLRELQQRAPGTYNHSLNVAALAESAADAIHANGLLTYVGALYHDIGKMNKPEYFVENQIPGTNKHDRLSPAMSLLVVVGHVKDGMELAREYKLPKQLQHFIEAHHGTTLVEYFYHRAKQQALTSGDSRDEAHIPDEVEYRYPGPRPRTKEVAVLMVCDAVESATRAMSDPTPSRIEALVESIANKRLLDGQFDDCELTLRELKVITESVSRTLASMYHGRIAYPTDKQDRVDARPKDAVEDTELPSVKQA
ncbi:MAG: HD family phosphohydrolase [Phycisphaerales bacterium]|nr:MAG: HDIG domain-containing protein [Phycisphaerales bacterium]